MNFSSDIAISQLNEIEYQLEMENRKRKRRSKIISPEALIALRDSGEREEGYIFLCKGDPIADLCEAMLQERSSGGLIRALQEQKREEEASLIEMMMKGGLRPVKITEWAEKAGIDEYYLETYARELCKTLPLGIVKMKEGNFVMGDALTEYVNLYKIIYAHEIMAILDENDKKSEKEIATNLGVVSLEGFLAMKTIKDVFFVENKNRELIVSMRA